MQVPYGHHQATQMLNGHRQIKGVSEEEAGTERLGSVKRDRPPNQGHLGVWKELELVLNSRRYLLFDSHLRKTAVQLSGSDIRMNELNLELGILKSELHKKTREMQALEAQVHQQQESLNRAGDRLKDTKRAAASKIHDKESKCEALQKELLKAQNQYSACYDELLHREKLLHKFKEENIQLTEQITQQSQDISKMSEERKKLELKLAVVTERHKTAQQEVNNRDQIILQLKTDLKTSQEKYFGSQEELSLQEAEISRLQQKIRCLQNEARELWEKCNEQEDQLNQIEKAKQQLFHEQEIHLGQIQNYAMIVEKLQSDLDQTKQSHTMDLDRWNQKTLLMQKELISETSAHQADLLKMQECKEKIASLELKLESANDALQEAKQKIDSQDQIVKGQNTEMEHLQQQVKTLEEHITESCSQTKALESALDVCKKKFRTCIDTIKSLEKHVGHLQEQLKESTGEIANKKETIQSLEAEVSILQRQYKEKSVQVETFEHLIDQLTAELNSSKDDVKMNKEQYQQFEQLAGMMKEKVDRLQKQITEKESDIAKICSELKDYRSSHSHSNEEYNSHALQLQKHQHEIEFLNRQLNEKNTKIEECQRIIEHKNTEALKVLDQQKKYSLEIEELEKTLRSLQMEILTSQQKHKIDAIGLEQQVARLEAELTDTRSICAQKDQAIGKRDDLLRKSEGDLLQAREGIKEKAAEAEHLDSVVKQLEERIQDVQKKMNQKEKENDVLRAEMKDLGTELQEVHKLYRETAQELASQEEKLLLLESSLKATQDQLSKQIAETVRQEQNSRKYQTDLKILKERLTASEEENSEYKKMLENLKTELTSLKDQHQLAVQESLRLQQANHKYETEMASVQANAHNLQQQAQNFEELIKGLREELNQGQNQAEEMRKQTVNMEDEMERLRSRNKNDGQKIKEQENQLIKLENEVRRLQEENSSTQSDFLQAQAQMKILQLNHSTAETQIKHYMTQADFYEETIAKLREDLEQSKKRCRKSTKSLESAEQNIYDLNLEMTLLQSNHKQTVEQLNEKNSENSAITSEVNRLRHQNKKIREELSRFKLKLEQANMDPKKLQQVNQSSREEAPKQEESGLEGTDKHQTIEDIDNREKKLAVLKREHTDLLEKLKVSFVEVRLIQGSGDELQHVAGYQESNLLDSFLLITLASVQPFEFLKTQKIKFIGRQKRVEKNDLILYKYYRLLLVFQIALVLGSPSYSLICLLPQLEILCQALEATQTDNSRLHRESEFVAANVNQWIKEQKLANKNLGEKIHEQNQLLAHLTEERDNFQKREEALLVVVNNLKADLEKMKTENEQLKFVKENVIEQQELNMKLRRQLDTQELEHTSLMEKNRAATEDMHSRLQSNIKSIHFLNQKLNELGKENGCLRQQLEDGKLRCQQYERHLETCNQTVSNLFTHLKVIQEQRNCFQKKSSVSCLHNIEPPLTTGAHAQLQMFSQKETVNGESEELVLKDSLDKSCWRHCTDERSTPLQDNTEYWIEKMNGLMLQIQQLIGTPGK
ncbi:uncharacterized protein [Pyxicephalus adspersus]